MLEWAVAAHMSSSVDVEGVVGPSVWTGGESAPPSWVVLDDGAAALCLSSAAPHYDHEGLVLLLRHEHAPRLIGHL